jgi:hypothetical protein
MNEQIKQLAEQAKRNEPFDCGALTKDQWLEKFAELIVQECIEVLNKRFMGDLNREDQEVRRCIKDLKKHFGVE